MDIKLQKNEEGVNPQKIEFSFMNAVLFKIS